MKDFYPKYYFQLMTKDDRNRTLVDVYGPFEEGGDRDFEAAKVWDDFKEMDNVEVLWVTQFNSFEMRVGRFDVGHLESISTTVH